MGRLPDTLVEALDKAGLFQMNLPRSMGGTESDRDRVLASEHPLTFGSVQALTELYGNAGVTPDQDVITYCGLGYAAACGLLALKLLGHERVRVYDGSWTEWSADPSLPVEISPQP